MKKFLRILKTAGVMVITFALASCSFVDTGIDYEDSVTESFISPERSASTSSISLTSTDFSKLASSSNNTNYPSQTISKDSFSLLLQKGSNATYNPVYASSKLRVYANNTLKFQPKDNYKITKIVFVQDSGTISTANTGSYSGNTWKGEATTSSPVTFTCAAKKNITSITVTVEEVSSGSSSGSSSSSSSSNSNSSSYLTSGEYENTALYLGNPSGAKTSTSLETNYLMKKTTYALSYNNQTHNPNWVSWHLASSDLGSLGRTDNFHTDSDLPSGWYKVTTGDYTGSGYTRGHMIPHSHRTTSSSINNEVFAMTNMVPQIAENNNTVWEGLESTEVEWAKAGKELYIICGPYYNPNSSPKYMKSSKTSTKTIRIPDSTWRVEIILDKTSTGDISRINSSTDVIAINVPNTSDCYSKAKSAGYDAKTAWKYYICTIDTIEAMTGYDFFANLSDSIENALEAKKYK